MNLSQRLWKLPRSWLLALLPLWAFAYAIAAQLWATQQISWITVFVAPQPGSYPIVAEIMPGVGVEGTGAPFDERLLGASRRNWLPVQAERLQLGDRIVRVGDADLTDAGRLQFLVRFYEAATDDLIVPLQIERDDQTRLAFVPLQQDLRFDSGNKLVLSLVFVVVALLILWRAPDTRASRLFYLAWMALATYIVVVLGPGPPLQTRYMLLCNVIAHGFAIPLQLLAIMAMVQPTARPPRWPWVFAIFALSPMARVTAWPLAWTTAFVFTFALSAIGFLTILIVLARGFRRADALGRWRLKWVVYGFMVGILPSVALSIVVTAKPSLMWMFDITMVFTLLAPLSVLVATVRAQLFDIDRLIGATTAFSLLIAALIGAMIAVVPHLAHAVGALTGMPAGLLQALVSFVLAAIALPGYRRLRPWIDRAFFAERQALERGIEQLLRELSACRSAPELLTKAGDALDGLLRPETCVIYARSGDAYAPVYARGRTVPPVLPLNREQLAHLQQRNLAQNVSTLVAGLHDGSIERAALESLGAAVLLPVTHGDALAAVVGLGHKRSGDGYVGTDLALLTAVAHAMSRELRHFDEAELYQQARTMQGALRRYVPGAIASRLEQGKDLEPAEREVTVLFVDIRGYTRYAETRSATEIFTTVSRYTEAVSAIVREHQGAVVEFNGDGLMTVFGAPEPLDQKERAALRCARAIVRSVRSMSLGGAEPLEVGIGVATGPAFVGNIKAVDRVIWGAIGNTTNLAARLQALSREHEAAVVIDATTRERAADLAADFTKHSDVAIRGSGRMHEIYTLAA